MRILKYRWRPALFLISIPVLGIALTSPYIVDNFRAEAPAAQLKVSLSERRMSVMEDGKVVRTYPVAIGMPSNPTPTGTFRTGRIVWNPGWNPPNSEWARGQQPRAPGDPKNPMQGVKIYFREPAYYIHGTNAPASIGQAASRGCLRMRTEDAKALASWIENKGGGVQLTIQG